MLLGLSADAIEALGGGVIWGAYPVRMSFEPRALHRRLSSESASRGHGEKIDWFR